MPLFTFLIDSDGEPTSAVTLGLPNAESACREAVRACAEITLDASNSDTAPEPCRIKVLADDGATVCIVRFSVERVDGAVD